MPAYLSATMLGVLCFFVLSTGYLVLDAARGGESNGNGGNGHGSEGGRAFALGRAERGRTAPVPFPPISPLTIALLGALVIGVAMLAIPPHHPVQLAFGLLMGLAVGSSLARQWQGRTRDRFTESLPDALDLLASSLRTGQPIRTGFELVAREMPAPLGPEFAELVREIELGGTEVEALEHMADRLDSIDVQMLVTSIAVQKEVGGNLAEILGTLAQTIRSRFKIMGQVDAHTAQARLSAKVLVALPVVFAVALYWIRPGYLAVLLTDPIGHAVLLAALVCWGLGWLAIRQILAIKV